ncbi:MAG: rhodanese-like domain-containing protein [Campylobacterota bacterium]|nr:rhodanese-like domain-containing protein [Campylobacterota bacterium]
MFKKFILSIMILSTALFATVEHIEATPNAFKGMKVVDIRTPGEWMQTGIVKDSYTIMFFDEQGQYDVDAFLKQLNMVVKKDEKFALICRTGSRTTMISEFLANKLGYNVVNLRGGIMHLMAQGYKSTAYKK